MNFIIHKIMRKLFLLLFVAINVPSFAQRFNMNGEKVVSSVCIDGYNVLGEVEEHADIYFTYNTSLQLEQAVRIIATFGDKYKDILTKDVNGNFIRTSYFNGKKSFDSQYEYKTNEKGLIMSKIDKGDAAMFIFDYVYDCDRLVQISHKIRYKSGREWVKGGRDDMSYICFDYIDNNCYWDKMWSALDVNDIRRYYNTDMHYDNCSYSDIVNDTNINPNLFVFDGGWYISLDVYEFELATEWCGLKSKNIVIRCGGFEIMTQKDNKGNLVELVEIGESGRIYRRVKLTYLY